MPVYSVLSLHFRIYSSHAATLVFVFFSVGIVQIVSETDGIIKPIFHPELTAGRACATVFTMDDTGREDTGLIVFEWQDSLSVGVTEFDTHHKRLISLINKLRSSLARGDDGGVTREVLTEVSNYTMYHFRAEEDLMEKFGYPGFSRHRHEHLELISKTLQLMGEAYNNKADIGKEVLEFLVGWLKNHILITDKQYSAFFAKKGIS
jgi:hemerythrin